MSKSSMRIVLVDPLGEILFSGESMSGESMSGESMAAPVVTAASTAQLPTDASCPETQRSATSDSGIYTIAGRGPSVSPAEPKRPTLIRLRTRAA